MRRIHWGSSIQKGFALAVCVYLLTFAGAAQQASDPLLTAFKNPPQTARPEVWWHWVNGNVTPEGIKLDLEWMKRAGVSGFQAFDGNLATGKVVPKPLMYMTPGWKDAFKQATVLADQLGLEEGIASSPGWSESGARGSVLSRG